MPNLPHLALPRVEFNLPRKKTGFGRVPTREHTAHGGLLKAQLTGVLGTFRTRPRPAGIDPNLVLRVQLNPSASVDEESWERCGLVLLSADENRTLVLFASDSELTEFKRRLQEYETGATDPDQKSAPHTAIFACIDSISSVGPEDRIGRLFRATGVTAPSQFEPARDYVVDLELWDYGNALLNRQRLDELRRFLESGGGRVTDEYQGESLSLLRAKCNGQLIQAALALDSVAFIDLPPAPSFRVAELLAVSIDDIAPVPAPPEGSPAIGVLDSGVTSGHPLLSPALGEATTVPLALGDAADGHGHGTMVAGIALYGDVEECVRMRSFVPRLVLYSARVLNDACLFDDEHLITSQMRDAIRYLRETYGCRVFNVSLGDDRLPYQNGKVSPWASVLDTLARDLDVVIVVSAGNFEYDPGIGESPDGHVHEYPRYLLSESARIIEPATGAVVLTVGALAHSAGLPAGSAVALRPIAQAMQPSPFTRAGPGLGGSIKPEVCEVGGNHAYDGTAHGTQDLRELGVVSTGHQYVENLFAVDIGTSFAAPKVSHVAARLMGAFPEHSANMIRALIVASAQVPPEAQAILESVDPEAVRRVCGYGRPRLDVAQYSDDDRVLLRAESTLEFDKFHIYELPVPREFTTEKGRRRISVTLAYDPPVRHTRFDYLGVKMSFRLVRGKTAEEIAEAFRARSKSEAAVDRLSSTKYDCDMVPGPDAREGGTLQRGVHTMSRAPNEDYGETYHLVVRCERKWARDEHGPQRYAVVVMMEHPAQIGLYAKVSARLGLRVRAQQRATG